MSKLHIVIIGLSGLVAGLLLALLVVACQPRLPGSTQEAQEAHEQQTSPQELERAEAEEVQHAEKQRFQRELAEAEESLKKAEADAASARVQWEEEVKEIMAKGKAEAKEVKQAAKLAYVWGMESARKTPGMLYVPDHRSPRAQSILCFDRAATEAAAAGAKWSERYAALAERRRLADSLVVEKQRELSAGGNPVPSKTPNNTPAGITSDIVDGDLLGNKIVELLPPVGQAWLRIRFDDPDRVSRVWSYSSEWVGVAGLAMSGPIYVCDDPDLRLLVLIAGSGFYESALVTFARTPAGDWEPHGKYLLRSGHGYTPGYCNMGENNSAWQASVFGAPSSTP